MRRSRKKLGATIGGLAGVAVGVVIVARETTGEGCAQCGIAVGILATPFALLGAAIAPGDRWAAEDPRKVRFGIAPAPAGVGVRLSVAF